jgi:holo-[acyl-carrier protein] synthase
MIVGLGMDIIEIERIRSVYLRHQKRFVKRILTAAEQAYVLRFADPSSSLAGRWAAKEAALKALGTGLAEGIGWRDIEILPDPLGKPILTLHDRACARAKELAATHFHVTITHSELFAVAQVILESSQ